MKNNACAVKERWGSAMSGITAIRKTNKHVIIYSKHSEHLPVTCQKLIWRWFHRKHNTFLKINSFWSVSITSYQHLDCYSILSGVYGAFTSVSQGHIGPLVLPTIPKSNSMLYVRSCLLHELSSGVLMGILRHMYYNSPNSFLIPQ